MRLNFPKFFAVCLFFYLPTFIGAQTNTNTTEVRDQAVDNITSVLFDSQNRINANKITDFENECGVKLQFRVEDESLDKLGGLSEHIFKLWQTFVTPVNTKVNTITGEFSVLADSILSEKLSYRTYVTQDLQQCLLSSHTTDSLDASINNCLKPKLSETQMMPQSLDAVYGDISYIYKYTIQHDTICPDPFRTDPENYARHTARSKTQRAANWNIDINSIGTVLKYNFEKLEGTFQAPVINGTGAAITNFNIGGTDAKHVINENNSVNECTRQDMEVRCQILYATTKIRYLFLTKTLNYFIPKDSIRLFADEVTKPLLNAYPANNIIVVLWLKVLDGDTSSAVFTVRQNGDFLTKADIKFALRNNGDTYTNGTFYKFNNIYRNIPKPLVLCYQVAKINGLVTTAFFKKDELVKGREQIYYHSFKIDKAFDEIHALGDTIGMHSGATAGGGGSAIGITQQYNQSFYTKIDALRNKQKLIYLKALTSPQLVEAQQHIKENYLQTPALTKAAALKFLKDNYGAMYPDNRLGEQIGNTQFPEDLFAGTCKSNGQSSVIEDVLNISSLLLTPVGLDFIPDALSVVYYVATGQTLDAFLASASFFIPGSLCGAKRLLNGSLDIFAEINKGNKLLLEAGQVSAIEQDINRLTSCYKLDPSDVDASLVSKINNASSTTQKLLPSTAEQAQIWANTEKLDPKKRIEFINKCYDDPSFAQKCLNNPDEVLKWGGIFQGAFTTEKIASKSGFFDNYIDILSTYGITLEEFKTISGKAVKDLSDAELGKINSIRNLVPTPSSKTVLQKVIPKCDISKYLDGSYTFCKGYMAAAADCKHLTNFEDIYYGMRLDYVNTKFDISDGSCGVIRFRSTDANKLEIPRSADNFNLGNEVGSFPFTGHGFTSASNGRLTIPEWKSSEMMNFEDSAELWEIDSSGKEILKAIYSKKESRFIATQ